MHRSRRPITLLLSPQRQVLVEELRDFELMTGRALDSTRVSGSRREKSHAAPVYPSDDRARPPSQHPVKPDAQVAHPSADFSNRGACTESGPRCVDSHLVLDHQPRRGPGPTGRHRPARFGLLLCSIGLHVLSPVEAARRKGGGVGHAELLGACDKRVGVDAAARRHQRGDSPG